MSSHLSPQDLHVLREALRAQRDVLEAQQRHHLDGQSRADHARELLLQDGDDASQRDADREVDLAMSDREVVELAAVNSALQRLETGQFGRCIDCDAPIPMARLRLAPYARRCVACESQTERGQPRPARL